MSKVIGLTGQSGAGKTTVSEFFRLNGFSIINCDIVARQVTETGSECNRELAKHFPECFSKELKLDRQKLANEVFSDKAKLELLDSIIYPHINRLIKLHIDERSEVCQYILLDAPTLFEAGADKLCDVTVSVTADRDIRLQRIIDRDGISKELAEKRFASQHSEEFFERECDYVIRNNGSPENAEKETLEIIRLIKER